MATHGVPVPADGEREPDRPEPLLYAEEGWSWWWVLATPAFCLSAGLVEYATGAPVHTLMLLVCALGSAGSHAVMILSTRVHGRLRLTTSTLTQGTESLPVSRIVEVYPPAVEPEGRFGGPEPPVQPWQEARTLGELREVPRNRTAVGLRLDTGSQVRAWARDDTALRAALQRAVGAA